MRRSKDQVTRDRMRLLGRATKDWLSTKQLGNAGDLKWLEGEGLVVSQLGERKGEKRLFFCVECAEVITGENYADHRGHKAGTFYPTIRFREWRITAAGESKLVALRKAAPTYEKGDVSRPIPVGLT